MIRIFTFVFILLFYTSLTALGQSITISPVDAGTYGAGSSIAVSIKIADAGGKLNAANVFKLYLSDASGSFASEKEIGSYNGFYTTFVNGTIPSGLPAGNYKVRLKNSSTSVISAASNSFKIDTKTGVVADIDANSNQVVSTSPKTFGICRPEKATTFKFSNNCSTGATASVTITNEINPSDVKQYDLNSSPLNVTAEMAHYTIFVKAELSGVIGTKAFFLINNPVKPGFNSPSNNTVCLPAVLEYDIETASVNGIQNNFPGYTYQVNWGDDSIEDITYNQILASGGKIRHTYNRSSCGKQIKINEVNYYNVFGIIYQVNSPYCGLISVPLSTQAKVITQPENRFSLADAVCLNTPLEINNSSIAGDNPSATSPECTNNNIMYYWYVDGKPVTPQGVPISYKLNYTFTTPGFHTIRLESESNSICQAAPLQKTCYVQDAPKPKFLLSEIVACTGSVIKASDQSLVDAGVKAQNTYLWNVKGPSEVKFVNSSNTSKNPEFSFPYPGIYTIQLNITSPCGPSIAEQTVTINETPLIKADWQTNLCGKGQLLTFNNSEGNLVKTSFSGTDDLSSNQYTWTITGGAFSFKNNTNQNSKEPSVLFEDNATYSITATHHNNCGSSTITKTLTFNESPVVSAGKDQTICAGNPATLNASITQGSALSFKWIGGNGSFTPSRSALNPIYTPSADEITAGIAELKFSVITPNPAPCNIVEDVLVIKINPVNKISSAPAKTICTNTPVDYQPIALVEGSTVSWTATGSANAKGFSETGSGDIKDVLINSDPIKNAAVKYVITPFANGCAGEPFTLVVTVTATPQVTATIPEQTICSGKESKISLLSNLPGMRYTWTSTASPGITGNIDQSTPVAVTEITCTLTNASKSSGAVTYYITPENTSGCSGKPVTITINVSASPGVTIFSPNRTTGCSPLSITFNNTTPGSLNTYYWDFGDGQKLVTSDNKAVEHTYVSAVTKNFTARLVTQTDCGSYTSEYIIRISPNTVIPELVVNGNEYEGCAPHTVKFFNNSKGALLFKYDFGDGTIIETNRSPENIIHTFTKGGTYKVKLTASNGCSDTTTTETITVYPQAITDFSADVTEGCSSVTTKFKNKSTGALSYLWDFDDGTVSTEINPTHIFSSAKSAYTIKLITTSSFGCTDTLEFPDYIKVRTPPSVNFQVLPGETIQYPDYHFSFKDKTIGDIKSREWDFGDGSISSKSDPEHNYLDTGAYKVKLTVINTTGCSATLVKTVRITGTPGSLFIPNAFMPNSLTEELRTFKAKGSGIEKWHMRVFNKWGEMIWQTDKLDNKGVPSEGWDGTMSGVEAPQGIYFWEIAAKFRNGTEWAGMIYNNSEPKKTGTINLIR